MINFITHVDEKYSYNLFNHFLPSYFQYHPNDILTIIDFGLNTDSIKKLNNYELCYNKIVTPANPMLKGISILEQKLNLLNKEYQQCVIIDAGDILFQDNIADVFDILNNIGLVEENDLVTGEWDKICMRDLSQKDQNYILEKTNGYNRCNFGVIYGLKDMLIKCFLQLIELMSKNLQSRWCWIEQTFINLMCRTENYFTILDKTYNFVAQSWKYYVVNNKIVDIDNNVMKVLHNAGSRPINFDLIK